MECPICNEDVDGGEMVRKDGELMCLWCRYELEAIEAEDNEEE
jgi:uncharacterized Zn finger protein (UPF0148 family)